VRDVDSYLTFESPTQTRLVLSYARSQIPGALLDIDDTNWVGPETVTILNIPQIGTYLYYVNNYGQRNETSALGKSGVSVKVYKGAALLKQYEVPPGIGINWEVFKIVDGVFDDSQTQRYNDNLYMD
jgi:hypothetical protein